jgi:cyclic pyranopterin phosphate synthase
MSRSRANLTHLDRHGKARMVDVSAKRATAREAVARGRVFLHRDALERVTENRAEKGDVLTVARIAAVQAVKRTSELIPLAHPLAVAGVDLEFELDRDAPSIGIQARVRCQGPTGVEMEALTAVAVAALTIYDMLKAVDRAMVIGEIALWEKRGGRSGVYRRRG